MTPEHRQAGGMWFLDFTICGTVAEGLRYKSRREFALSLRLWT